jgi:NAD kinase
MIKVFNLDAIIAIGGDGTFKGARDLARKGIPVIGILVRSTTTLLAQITRSVMTQP